MEFLSFAFTLRTNIGINKAHIKLFERWLKKQPYGVYVFEKENDERHIHGQIWLDSPRTRGNVKKILDKHVINCYELDEYKLCWAVNVKIAYNNEFLEKYMTKENPWEYYKVPADNVIYDFYPPEDTQERIQKKAKSKNGWLLELEDLWNTHATEHWKALPNIVSVASFLQKIAGLDLWRVVKDARLRQQEAQIFQWWLNKNTRGDLYLTKEQMENRDLMEKWKTENGKENQDNFSVIAENSQYIRDI